ncbi:MAG: hypothetical protein Q4F13_02760 [Pseudomonadota bacterium]|nr:hypothetical protein [Pseudomonadota bacterium]
MKFIRLRYTGRKNYRDKLMRLDWTTGAEQLVTPEAAQKLLRFAEFSLPDKGKPAKAEVGGEVEAATLAVQQVEQQEQAIEATLESVLTEVDMMDKDALEAMAARYESNLDKRRSVQALRLEVRNLVEQYGVR